MAKCNCGYCQEEPCATAQESLDRMVEVTKSLRAKTPDFKAVFKHMYKGIVYKEENDG